MASGFTQILIGAGYAGFFATWNWVNPYLSRVQTLAIAALLALSILLFVLWQVFQFVIIGRQQFLFFKTVTISNTDFDVAMKKQQGEHLKVLARTGKLWLPAVAAITIPGILGAGLLIVACVEHTMTL